MVEMIQAEDFSAKVLKSEKPVIVDFFATWCGPCKMLAPVLEDLDKAMEGKLSIVKIDIDEPGNDELVEMYRIQAVPTLIFVKDGKVVEKMQGIGSRDELVNATLKLFD